MIVDAALTGPLPKLGVVAAGALVALVLLATDRRWRSAAMLAALVLAPVLLLADIWHSPQLSVIHRHPLPALAAAVVAVAALLAVARLIGVRPWLFAPLAVFALPFRVPIQAGGSTSNLLVPLYFVVAAGALAVIVPTMRQARRRPAVRSRRPEGRHGVDPQPAPPSPFAEPTAPGAAGWVSRLLALYVVLYALQATYSADFEKALQQMVFFYVPFALLFDLLRRVRWTPRLIRNCLALLVTMALVFSLVGFLEYATKTIILNPKLVVANDLHAYFTVNSVFFDPDIFGRFLALTMILVAVVLLYPRPPRESAAAVGALAVLWACLVLTLSRSSLGALLVGLAVLAALRYRPSRALLVALVVIAFGAAAVAVSPKTFGLNQGVNGASSGRGGLVSGGLSLWTDRPLWGYGSGSFITEYRRHHRQTATTLSASHTIPITIAAEQGLIGELAYAALVVAALLCLLRRSRGDPARCAVGAAFAALVLHTMLYADFLEDPVTWALLGIGVALASAGAPARRPLSARRGAVARSG
ncbi:MAG: O-antigen ligase family protein [Solirubrobacterales bacterium]|nr:O-antigen ligase family protein [Solirubrobacterales bacterium]